jgi:uncharacterized protein (TIGR03083 family)
VKHLPPTELVQNFLSGVAAVEDITGSFDDDDWSAPGCGQWSAADTVRHLVGVIDWYEQWLDRALAGNNDSPFSESEFESRNAAAIADLQHLDGAAAVAMFGARARSYLDKALDHLDTPFGYPAGTVTVGLHLGVAAIEWHLHAWDIVAATGKDYEPDNPESLFVGAGACVAATKGGVSGRLLGLVLGIAAKRSPWQTILKESGRGQSAG